MEEGCSVGAAKEIAAVAAPARRSAVLNFPLCKKESKGRNRIGKRREKKEERMES